MRLTLVIAVAVAAAWRVTELVTPVPRPMRVVTVAVIPAAQFGGVHAAATLWSLAFLLYLWRYTPFLLRARVDGGDRIERARLAGRGIPQRRLAHAAQTSTRQS